VHKADSLNTDLTLTPDEFRILLRAEVDRKLTYRNPPTRPPAEGFERTLQQLAPVIIGAGAIYMSSLVIQNFAR
jgi:hypothetical protein